MTVAQYESIRGGDLGDGSFSKVLAEQAETLEFDLQLPGK